MIHAQRREVGHACQFTKHRTTLSKEGQCADIFGNTTVRSSAAACVVTSRRDTDEKSHVLMFIDITRAHPHCTTRRQVWVQLLAEDPRGEEEGVCGLPLRSIYGLRGAGMNFEQLTRQVMDKLGFTCGLWTPCVFVNCENNMQAFVYGDNFVIEGVRRELYDFFEQLKVHLWAKSEGVLGPDPGQGDVREVVCLNRVFRWCLPTSGRAEAIEIEADAWHVEILIHQLNRRRAMSLATPGVKSTSSDMGLALLLEKHTPFRSMCMRASYLTEDQPDVRFACKETARLVSEPCEAGWDKLKRLGRYLAGVPRLVQRMERQDPPRCVLALSGSDHAGCLRTRRSTTCNILVHGDHFLKMICSTQVPIALSSGESEWYALTHAGCAVIGLKNWCRDMGRDLAARMAGDASAASGIGARRGVGKIGHLETRTLWFQKHITERRNSAETEEGLGEPERLRNETPRPSNEVEACCSIWVSRNAMASPS